MWPKMTPVEKLLLEKLFFFLQQLSGSLGWRGGVMLGEGPEGRGVTAAVITPIKFKWRVVVLLPLPPPTCIVVWERGGVLAAAAAAPPS